MNPGQPDMKTHIFLVLLLVPLCLFCYPCLPRCWSLISSKLTQPFHPPVGALDRPLRPLVIPSRSWNLSDSKFPLVCKFFNSRHCHCPEEIAETNYLLSWFTYIYNAHSGSIIFQTLQFDWKFPQRLYRNSLLSPGNIQTIRFLSTLSQLTSTHGLKVS